MSKWTKANEYVPVTKGSTAVITLQSDGDIYGYMDASTTGVLLASASAGVTKVPTGSFSKITCTAPFILTTESAMSRLRGGQGGTSGGGGAGSDWITANDEGEAVLNFPEKSTKALELLSLGRSRYTKLTGSTGGKKDMTYFLSGVGTLTSVDLYCPSVTSFFRAFENIICTSLKVIAPYTISSGSFSMPGLHAESLYLDAPNLRRVYADFERALVSTFTFRFSSMQTISFDAGGQNMGVVTSFKNVTVLDGGLGACTSFAMSKCTNLSDASIQNIIDALPDYSGTETSALVSFPPDRLTPAQQEQLTNKGWTWS